MISHLSPAAHGWKKQPALFCNWRSEAFGFGFTKAKT
jgi:hypothetical protein